MVRLAARRSAGACSACEATTLAALVELGQRLLRLGVKQTAGVRRANPSTASLEQRRSESMLEPDESLARGGLRQFERLSSGPDRSVLDCGHKRGEFLGIQVPAEQIHSCEDYIGLSHSCAE